MNVVFSSVDFSLRCSRTTTAKPEEQFGVTCSWVAWIKNVLRTDVWGVGGGREGGGGWGAGGWGGVAVPQQDC